MCTLSMSALQSREDGCSVGNRVRSEQGALPSGGSRKFKRGVQCGQLNRRDPATPINFGYYKIGVALSGELVLAR